VVYLEPDPEEPFTDVTAALAERFGVLPYSGAFSNVIPHLTVAILGSFADRLAIKRELSLVLPVYAQAAVAWLMVGENSLGWKLVHEVGLHT